MKSSVMAVAICLVIGCSSGSGSSGGSGGSGSGGSGGSGGAGQCPNVAGTWTVKSHCQSSFVGAQVPITQSGCTATDDEGTQFTLASDGSFSFQLPDGSPCTGTATETSVNETCTVGGQECVVTLGK